MTRNHGEESKPTAASSGLAAWPARLLFRFLLNVHWIAMRMLRRRSRAAGAGYLQPKNVLLTGTFFSENWILNHLKPLVASPHCQRVWLVTTFPVPHLDKVEVISPPSWLVRGVGAVPARLLLFVVTAFRRRPDFVGGFHLLPNGLVAILLARLIGSRSVYFCGGGSREVEGGGYLARTRLFSFLKAPDVVLEAKLLRAVDECDLVITMGRRAREYFRARGVRSRIEIVPGGIDGQYFESLAPKKYDVILVGRLHPVKRIDLFIKAVADIRDQVADISAVVVGGGELEESLKLQVAEAGLAGRLTFAGQQSDVRQWLAQSKVFVLTSESEGLSLALMEAMAMGLPGVVSDVGELADLVEHGKTGFLVDDASPETFSRFVMQLLRNDVLRSTLSRNARTAAMALTTVETAKRWDHILSDPGLSSLHRGDPVDSGSSRQPPKQKEAGISPDYEMTL